MYASYKDVLSETFTTAMLPHDRAKYDFGEALYEFQVISDVHQTELAYLEGITSHFDMALADIKANSPNSLGIFINGDIADNGTVANYQFYLNKIKKANLPFGVYASIGNHDWYQHTDAYFKKYANPTLGATDKVYFDFETEEAYFIFIGGDSEKDEANISQTQREWFKEKLETRDTSKRTFVFLHQGFGYTVGGTYGENSTGWTGTIVQEKEIREILKDHTDVVMFSSHTHYDMNGKTSSMFEKTEDLPTMFNTAAVIQLSTDKETSTKSLSTESQGLYLTVYEDAILVQGREFVDGQWIPAAQFYVDLRTHTFDDDCDGECNDCGALRNAPHNYTDAWTADEDGHWHVCADCQGKSETIGHVLGDWIKNQTSHYKECSICSQKVEQGEHAFGDWVVTKEATQTATGSREKTCGCGEKVVETIPKINGGSSTDSSPDDSSGSPSDSSSASSDEEASGCNSTLMWSGGVGLVVVVMGVCLFVVMRKKKKE